MLTSRHFLYLIFCESKVKILVSVSAGMGSSTKRGVGDLTAKFETIVLRFTIHEIKICVFMILIQKVAETANACVFIHI